MKLIFHPASAQPDKQAHQAVSREGTAFSIGRGSDQDIPIADIRVPLQRARLVMRRGEPWIESQTPDPLWIDGHALLEAPLIAGRCIEIGRYTLEVIAVFDDGVELKQTARYGAQDELRQASQKFALGIRDLHLPVRAFSWALAILVVSLALLWPLWMSQADSPGVKGLRDVGNPAPLSQQASAPASAQRPPQSRLADFHSSGRLSAAHRHFADRCETCHQQWFIPVSDGACLQCHQGAALHGDRHQLRASATVAEPCTDCHLEHQADTRPTLSDARTCLQCHRQAGSGHTEPVSHFGREHPEFGQHSNTRGLEFSHTEHLSADGLRGSTTTEVLSCGSCHLADQQGAFQPIEFEPHCQRCHSIDVLADRTADAGAISTVVPHGPLDQVQDFLQGHFSQLALQAVDAAAPATRQPVGALSNPKREAALAWAQAQATREYQDLVTRRSCAVCHQLTQDGPPAITPPSDSAAPSITSGLQLTEIVLPREFMPASVFDHRSHQTAACQDCHAAEFSEHATDWLLPERHQCLSCHGGNDDRGDGLANCQTCHRFHNTALDWSRHPSAGGS